MTARAAIVFAALTFFLAATPAFAQFDLSAQSSSLTITSNPAHPTPGQTVQLTAQSPLIDIVDSDVSWTVNGQPAGTGPSISVTLGKLGTQSNVSVSVSGASGSDSAQLSIIPTSIDLLWEADSYTPAFYRGRALPTPGSSIRVMAMPHFVRANGAAVPASSIIFTWKVNGAVLQSVSGLGASSAVIPAAILFGSDAIVVDARTQDGTLSGEGSITIRTQNPQLVLYEDSPLFGIMYHQALGDQTTASESETSFVAMPYFADAVNPEDRDLTYTWTVNGGHVTSDTQNPNELTISAQSAQSAQVDLSLSNLMNPFVAASGAWNITFGSGGSATTNDAFHSQ